MYLIPSHVTVLSLKVNRFLETYSGMAKDIPPQSLAKLKAEFSRLSSEYLTAVGQGRSPSPQLAASLQAYLTSVRDTCRATWARFNPLKMAAGLAILAFACLTCFILSELSLVLIRENGPGLKAPVVVALAVGGCVAAGQMLTQGYVEVAWCLAAAAFSSELLFLWRAHRSRAVTVAKNSFKAPKCTTWLTPRSLLIPPLLVPLLRCASLLSDSYVIAEGRVVTFLVFSLALYIPIHLNWDGLLLPPSHDPLKAAGLVPSAALSPSTVRKESSTLLACLGLLIGSLYLSLSFHGCREEQGSCQPSPFLSPLSRLQDNQLKNLHYVLSVCSLGLWTYLLRRCLRHYGNLNSSGGTVFTARWILPLLSVCLAVHWAVSATPEDSFRNLAELISLAQLALPRAAFLLLGLGLFLIWLDPLTVFVKTRAAATARSTSLPPPRYRASTGISPQAELHHLIPQIYQRMRCSLNDGELSGGGEVDSRPAVEAYGLGTVYSAPLLLFCGLLGIGLLLLHPEGMALSFLLLLLETGALLHIHASSTTLSGLNGTHTGERLSLFVPHDTISLLFVKIKDFSQLTHLLFFPSGGFNVPWTPVVLWSLAATQFFHATGHLPTFPSIQWGAAFVGFPDGHTGTMLPASLVTLNTFASHILFAGSYKYSGLTDFKKIVIPSVKAKGFSWDKRPNKLETKNEYKRSTKVGCHASENRVLFCIQSPRLQCFFFHTRNSPVINSSLC